MSRTAEPDTRLARLFLIALVPAVLFFLVSAYVRITSDSDPLWTEFATPLFFALLGARALALPASPETRTASRWAGAVLIALSAIILILALADSQGAN